MALLLALLPIAIVVVVGGAIVVWALFDDERDQEEPAEQQASQALQELTAKRLVLFEPMAWSAELNRMPVEELVAKLELELVERRREAAKYANAWYEQRPDPS